MAQAMDRLKGTVRWFDVWRGFGFITPEDGGEDLFVHCSSIKAAGFRCLVEGEFVEFSVDVGDDGRTRASGVTGPGGASVQCASYGSGGQRGPCYSCGEAGHLARNCCLRNGGRGGVGPCYSCGEMGHFARNCPAPFAWYEEYEVEEDAEELSAGEQRNWAELPRDVLSVIFKKIAAIEIIKSAQFVCRPWRHLSHEPELWRCIDMTGQVRAVGRSSDALLGYGGYMAGRVRITLAMEAVRRSSGCLEEFHGEYDGNNELMDFMADRATHLRCLRLTAAHEMNHEGLVVLGLVIALVKFRLLEELELTLFSFSDGVAELFGRVCPHLKTVRLK